MTQVKVRIGTIAKIASASPQATRAALAISANPLVLVGVLTQWDSREGETPSASPRSIPPTEQHLEKPSASQGGKLPCDHS